MRRKLILASASKRRRELMELIGVPFEIHPASHEEEPDLSEGLERAIEKVALAKAQDIFKRYPDALVLGSDTIVSIGDEILGKPKDKEDARRMIRRLSGTTHHVITGVAFISKEEVYVTHDTTEVRFAPLSDEEIERYISTDEPYDKAGAYAVQGKSGVFVEGIKGDVYGVIGLPVHLVYQYLKKQGYFQGSVKTL